MTTQRHPPPFFALYTLLALLSWPQTAASAAPALSRAWHVAHSSVASAHK